MRNSNNMDNVLSHVDYRPISLPRKNALLVSTLKALQGKYIPLDIGLETWNLRFSGQPGLNAGPEAAMQAAWQGHRIAARFPQALLHRTLHTCRPELSLDDIPASLWSSMAGKLAGAWLAKLPHIQSLRIDKIEAHDAADDDVPDERIETQERLRIYLHAQRISPAPEDAVGYAIAVDVDPALLSSLPRLCESLPAGMPSSSTRFSNLPLPLRCQIGKVAVSYATLEALRLGDILFFDSYTEDLNDPSGVAMRLTHRNCPLLYTRLHSPDLMVVTEINMNDRKSFFYDDFLDESDPDLPDADNGMQDFETGMSINPAVPRPTGSDRQAHCNLNQLPLELVFDVGDCEMRLSELQALQIGSVIPLSTNKTEMVRVRVNGRVIASGELVEIDGKIGVMLARLADIQ
jgi:type III secretion system YscQ/HrcQ family protein